MKKLSITKEAFEKSKYFTSKYGKLEYVSESGKLFKTNKGKILMFKEYTDGYEGLSARELCASIGAPYHDDPLYGTQGYCGQEPDVDWEADREEYKNNQIKSGVILRRTNKVGDLWRIETVDSGMRLEENIHGFKKAEKLAKKNGWKIVKTIPKDAGAFNESRKFGKKFKESIMGGGEYEPSYDDDEEPLAEWKVGEIVDIDSWQVMWEYDDEERLPEKGWKIVKVKRDENYDDCDGYCYTIVNIRNPKLKVEVSASALVERKSIKKSGRKLKESTKKFGRKFMKEDVGDISTDPAYVCPYCGSRNCEFEDAEDLGSGLQEGYFEGATFNAQFWCNECNKPYNVTYELKVKDVYPSEEENLEIELPDSDLEDDDL